MATCPTCRTQYPADQKVCPADGQTLLPDEAFGNADGDLVVGSTVGEYQVEGKIGEGGFGAVYRAVHPLIGKLVAIKVLNRQYSSNPQMVSRFISEARAVNQIRHRNIIDIFAFGKLSDGRQYFVMELLDGQPLDRYLAERGRLQPDEAIAILGAVARALDAAHGCGVAHRDLKPENIFLERDRDGYTYPKLLDFGIAKLLSESTGHVTRTGMPIGTPAYMSPEQCRAKNVDHRTDIYSLGIVTYEMLTGTLPFDGETMMDLMLKQANEQPLPPSEVCPALPAAYDAPILHMLEKSPAARPETVVAAVEALAAAAASTGVAVPELSSRGGAFRSGPVTPAQLPSLAAQGKLTPSQPGAPTGERTKLASFGDAKTVAHPSGARTLQGAASDVAQPSGRKWIMVGGGVGAALVAGAVLAVVLGGGGNRRDNREAREARQQAAQGAPSGAGSASPASASASASSATPTASAPPSASASSAATDAEVDIELASVPDGTEVFMGDTKLGATPGAVHVPRGSAKVKLVLRATGYRDLEVEVTPDKNRTLSPPPMQKAPTASPPVTAPNKADKRELEDPNL